MCLSFWLGTGLCLQHPLSCQLASCGLNASVGTEQGRSQGTPSFPEGRRKGLLRLWSQSRWQVEKYLFFTLKNEVGCQDSPEQGYGTEWKRTWCWAGTRRRCQQFSRKGEEGGRVERGRAIAHLGAARQENTRLWAGPGKLPAKKNLLESCSFDYI